MKRAGYLQHDRSGEQGFSLISAIIAIGLTGIMIGVIAQAQSRMGGSMKKTALSTERAQIADSMLSKVSCNNTMAHIATPATCNGVLQEVYDKRNRLIVSKDEAHPTRIGNFTVRASCYLSPSGNGINIEVGRPKAGIPHPLTSIAADKFAKDSLTGAPLDWTTQGPTGYSTTAALYPIAALPCADQMDAALGPAPVVPVNSCPVGSVMQGLNNDGSVYCVPGAIYGGAYFEITPANAQAIASWPSYHPCSPNPMTGTCSCPAGFTSSFVFQMSRRCDATAANAPWCDFYAPVGGWHPGDEFHYAGKVCTTNHP